jgi:hypothetical protein
MSTRQSRAAANGQPDAYRRAQQRRPAQSARDSYRPAEGTPLLACSACGANYLDDRPSRAAHRAVFGHAPVPTGTRP